MRILAVLRLQFFRVLLFCGVAICVGVTQSWAATTLKKDSTGDELISYLRMQKQVQAKDCPNGSTVDQVLKFIEKTGGNVFTMNDSCNMERPQIHCEMYFRDRPLGKKGKSWILAFDSEKADSNRLLSVTCKETDELESEEEEGGDPAKLFSKVTESAECLKVYQSEKVQGAPTSVRRGLNIDAAECLRKTMVKKIDHKIIPLKSSHPVKFKAELELQKQFNQAVKKYCGRWESYYQSCCSACSFNEESECQMDLYQWRMNQIDRFSGIGGASVQSLKDPASATLIADFSGLANAICRSEDEAWENKKKPENCVDQALVSLEKAVHAHRPTLSCAQ